MRIVAGSARGRRLVVPAGDRTRPTTDRVREATFNALYSMDAIDGASFCDLFAGSGALGLEALSRGAASVVFVERDKAALEALRANIDTLGFGDQATVVAADSMRWLQNADPVDVLLADPPYEFDDWPQLFAAAKAEIVVAESGSPVVAIDGWESLRERAYGTTVVTVLRPMSHHHHDH